MTTCKCARCRPSPGVGGVPGPGALAAANTRLPVRLHLRGARAVAAAAQRAERGSGPGLDGRHSSWHTPSLAAASCHHPAAPYAPQHASRRLAGACHLPRAPPPLQSWLRASHKTTRTPSPPFPPKSRPHTHHPQLAVVGAGGQQAVEVGIVVPHHRPVVHTHTHARAHEVISRHPFAVVLLHCVRPLRLFILVLCNTRMCIASAACHAWCVADSPYSSARAACSTPPHTHTCPVWRHHTYTSQIQARPTWWVPAHQWRGGWQNP